MRSFLCSITDKIKSLITQHIALLVGFIFLLFWQAAGLFHLLPRYIIPTPLEIIHSFIRDWRLLLYHSKFTIMEALLGLFCGCILALILALIMDAIPLIQKALYPFLIITQTIPTIALAPILVLWLGYGLLPKVVLIILTTTFPIVISILDGFRHCDPDAIQLLRLMKANHWQILRHVKLPASLSYFYAGFRVSASYAFIAAVVAEWLGGFEGLGVYMIRAKKLFQYDTMFAIIVLTSAISLLSMKGIQKSERFVLPWKYKNFTAVEK